MTQAGEENRQGNLVKDIFFINIEDAYSEAVKQNKIDDEKGGERLQYCYYDGPLTDIVLDNFIQVSADSLVDFFSHNQLPVPQVIAISQGGVVHFNEMPADVIEEVKQYRSKYCVAKYIHFDTYFIDPLLALNVSKQRNRVYCGHPTIDGLQVCYYRGELPLHCIENLVHVELPELVVFFTVSRLRLPEKIEMPDELEEELKASVQEDLANALGTIQRNRQVIAQELAQKAKALHPVIVEDKPMRVFIPTSRLTTVMQYGSYNVAKAFERQGYDVLFYIEENDMMDFNAVDYMSRYIEFNPHITFNINHLNNTFLHEDVINIIWWQDLMPSIRQHQALAWREKDFNFSISPFLDEHLMQCGARDVVRQHFVVDEDIFNIDNAVDRDEKVVFVGSSYLPLVNTNDIEQGMVINKFVEIMNSGSEFDKASILEITSSSSLDYDFIFWKIFPYVIRDYSVKWLCATSSVPVDIYGRFWEDKEDVSGYFMGELEHGADVANVYKTAKYALVSHPFEINSQRLAEVVACGCIPVVYDCRRIAEKPHWDDYCLFFKNENELKSIIDNRQLPNKNPNDLAGFFTYKGAVENFIAKSDILGQLQ